MLVLRWVAGIAVALVLAYFALGYLYVWNAGLDLNHPSSAREWIRYCARGREDIYCEAAAHVLRGTKGPVIFLHPNAGDREVAGEMTRWSGQTPTSTQADAIARANLFFGSKLMAGTMKTLDGQSRRVVCPAPDQKIVCIVDNLRGGLSTKAVKPDDGAVYLMFNSKSGYNFLLPEAEIQSK